MVEDTASEGVAGRQRATTSVAGAALRLGCSDKYIHKLLDKPDEPLEGPPKPGRGRGRVRLVYEDTIVDQETRQRTRRRVRPGRDIPSEGRSTVSELRWALQQLNAATDALHHAAAGEAEVRKLLLAALERQDDVAALIRQSDQLRSEVIGVLLLPDDAAGL